jgi:hypothetical protein
MGTPVIHDAPEVGISLADHLDIAVQAALNTATPPASPQRSCRAR